MILTYRQGKKIVDKVLELAGTASVSNAELPNKLIIDPSYLETLVSDFVANELSDILDSEKVEKFPQMKFPQ